MKILNLLKLAGYATIPNHPFIKELQFSVIPSVLIHDIAIGREAIGQVFH